MQSDQLSIMVNAYYTLTQNNFFFNFKTAPASVINSAICSRFQFQCHSGECIAVYNACDGIPQCVDGSDEGPEVTELLTYYLLSNIVVKRIIP